MRSFALLGDFSLIKMIKAVQWLPTHYFTELKCVDQPTAQRLPTLLVNMDMPIPVSRTTRTNTCVVFLQWPPVCLWGFPHFETDPNRCAIAWRGRLVYNGNPSRGQRNVRLFAVQPFAIRTNSDIVSLTCAKGLKVRNQPFGQNTAAA